MSALSSLIHPPRAEANRRNAQKSTGPRTEAGKARSRRNALKHGLAGEGIALPGEDEAAVVGRFAALHEQFRPATPLGAYYVHRIALATVRTERLERHEAAALALRVRHAAEEFDSARAAGADAALDRLRLGEGRAARRDLLRTPEGIDRLLIELAGLRRCLELPEPLWSREHGARLDACLGVDPDPIVPSRVEALSVAALGTATDLLTRRDLAAIAEAGSDASAYALGRIVALIDEEIAALRADRAGIDPVESEADRAEAADRALFDPSPAAQLARRYEAAARRELDRSLRLLLEVEADAEIDPADAGSDAAGPESRPSTDGPSAPEPEPCVGLAPDPARAIKPGESDRGNSLSRNALTNRLAWFGDPHPEAGDRESCPGPSAGTGGPGAGTGLAADGPAGRLAPGERIR